MPKRINYQLSEADLKVVKTAITSDKRPEVRHRAVALQLLHQEMKPGQVAETLGVSLGSIYKWHARWRRGGLDALADQPRSGAPPKADEAYWARVGQLVEQDPTTLGYAFSLWTAERLIRHMQQETGIELSLTRFRTVLRQRGYVYRRPKHDLKSLQDPEARATAEEQLSELKRGRLRATTTYSLWTKAP
jgi:putative transposase